jgi:hypothetical protein
MLIKLQNQILTAQTKLKEQKLQCDQVSNNNTNIIFNPLLMFYYSGDPKN